MGLGVGKGRWCLWLGRERGRVMGLCEGDGSEVCCVEMRTWRCGIEGSLSCIGVCVYLCDWGEVWCMVMVLSLV